MGKLSKYWLVYVAAVSCLVAAVSLVHAPKAFAISSEFLDSSNTLSASRPWSDAYLSVAWRGTNAGNGQYIGLEARTNVTRIFYKVAGTGSTARNTFSITIVDACLPGFYAADGDITVSIENFNGTTSTPLAGRANIPNSGGNCSGNDMNFTVNRNELSSVVDSYGSDYIVAQIRVVKVNAVGTKWFRVRSNDDGKVTFAELPRSLTAVSGDPGYGTAFSMQDANSSLPATNERDYMFHFSPDCKYSPQFGSAYIRWFDADYGDIVENGSDNIKFTITIRSFATGQIKYQKTIDNNSTPSIGGDNQYSELQFPVTGPDDNIEWHWYNVNRWNGIQVWMPFSEMQTYIAGANGCGTKSGGEAYTADCSAITGWASDPDYAGPIKVFATADGPNGVGPQIGTVTADKPDPNGHGNHGFSMVYNGPKDTNPHQVYVYSIGVDQNGVASSDGPTLLSGSPKTVPACMTPEEFILEPQVVSVTIGDTESPGVITLSTHVDPQKVIPPAGIQATATRYVTVIKANGTTTTTPLGVDTRRFVTGGFTYNDPYDTTPLGLVAGDKVCTFIRVANTYHGMADQAGNVLSVTEAAKTSQMTCQLIVNKPYLTAYGGDVRAGGAFGDNVCVPSSANATIKTYAKRSGVSAALGSSVQFAAFALGAIDGDAASKGFFSASSRTTAPQPINGLTFANTGIGWGGNFATADHCIPDFTTLYRTPAVQALPTTDVSALPAGQYTVSQVGVNPVILIASGDISNKVTIFVRGNVLLRKAGASPGFRYSGAWPTVAAIPSLAIITEGGNIYIDYAISQLDGLYIAQPSTTSPNITGRIYTCADGANPAAPVFDPVNQKAKFSDAAAGCARTSLTVNGAFAAQEVRFSRTVNSLRNSIVSPGETIANTKAAEVFSYGPEIFMGMLNAPTSTASSTGTYDSITTLPPIY